MFKLDIAQEDIATAQGEMASRKKFVIPSESEVKDTNTDLVCIGVLKFIYRLMKFFIYKIRLQYLVLFSNGDEKNQRHIK